MAKEYITLGAVMCCIPFGKMQRQYWLHHNDNVNFSKQPAATAEDIWGLRDIPTFGVCNAKGTGKACYPSIKKIINKCPDVRIKGQAALTKDTKFLCIDGGTINFVTSGQVPLSAADMASIRAQSLAGHDEMIDAGVGQTAQGQSMGKAEGWEGYVPFYGNARNFFNACQKGNTNEQLRYGVFLWIELVLIPVYVHGTAASLAKASTSGSKALVIAKSVIGVFIPTSVRDVLILLNQLLGGKVWDNILEEKKVSPGSVSSSSGGTVLKQN